MKQWQSLLNKVLTTGVQRTDRTGVGTRSTFLERISFNLQEGFPAVTTKKLVLNQVLAELAAFLKAADTKAEFNAEGCTIWDANIDAWNKAGYAGRIYGVQWRAWRGYNGLKIDQLNTLISNILQDPTGRRHLVTAWNPAELKEMCLPPCHCFFQCYVNPNLKTLDLGVYMRSVDLFLGLPFDIASYAVLQHLITKSVGLIPRELIFILADSHIYNNHIEAVHTVLSRSPHPLPKLILDPAATINTFKASMVSLQNYIHEPFIPAPLNI